MASPNAIPCWICNKDVPIRECKFDEFGKPVHEECSVARISLRNATQQQPSRFPLVLHREPSTRRTGQGIT